MRGNPPGYVQYLQAWRALFDGNLVKRDGQPDLVTQEGVAAVDEAIRALTATQGLPTLDLADGLSEAGRLHVTAQGPTGETGHQSSAGTMDERIAQFGSWQQNVGENIDYGSTDARGVVLSLLIDDGVPSRGHRANILNGNYKVAGVASGTHAEYNTMCVQIFAGGFVPGPADGDTGTNGDTGTPTEEWDPE